MRKVVLYHLMSLDGIAYEDGDWLADDGPQLVAYLSRVIATQDDVLLGRGPYDYWAGHWPRGLPALRRLHQRHPQAHRHLQRAHPGMGELHPGHHPAARLRDHPEAGIRR